MRLPAQAARQLPDQSTILRVDSSSTDDSRLRGALPLPDSCTAAKAPVAVGMRVTSHPPHRSVRAAFPHPTLGIHGSYVLPYASQRL
jgi:hypothetical protein